MEMNTQTITWRLNDPGLTPSHRAGLAGLWMTLDALATEAQQSKRQWPDWINFPPKLQTHSVEIEWEGTPRRLLEWLLPQAFGIDANNQMIDLAGLRPAAAGNLEACAAIHNGILGTFLQHGKTRGVVKGQYTHPIQLDENVVLLLNYAKLEWYSHQLVADDFCTGDDWKDVVPLVGWYAPGSVVRHTAFATDTALEEPPQRALLLLFALVGCFYFNLRSTLHAQKARFALVIPEINDLAAYAKVRRAECHTRMLDLTACGTGDAALRVATRKALRDLRESCERCYVITLGTVAWSTQQKTRTAVIAVDLRLEQKLSTYDKLRRSLPNRVVKSKSKKKGEESAFIVTSAALEHFSDNLARGRVWYADFTELMRNPETHNVVKYEKEGLTKVIENIDLKDEERVIVDACHEAIRNRYGQIKGSIKPGDSLTARFEREYERLRVGLARCKNAGSLRQELTDLWSRAGQLKALQDNWSLVPPMFDEKNWARTRDLALLALASYKRPEKDGRNEGENGKAEETR